MIKQLNSCDDCNMCCKLPEIPSINKKSFSADKVFELNKEYNLSDKND